MYWSSRADGDREDEGRGGGGTSNRIALTYRPIRPCITPTVLFWLKSAQWRVFGDKPSHNYQCHPVNGRTVRGSRRRGGETSGKRRRCAEVVTNKERTHSEGTGGEALHFPGALRDAAVRANVDSARLLPQHLSSRQHPSIGPHRHRRAQATPLPSAPSSIWSSHGVTSSSEERGGSLFLIWTVSTYLLLFDEVKPLASFDYIKKRLFGLSVLIDNYMDIKSKEK